MRGSEAGVGWHRAVQAAKYFDTWVICEEHEFADEIRQYLADHGDIPHLHFAFVPMDRRTWAWGNIHDVLWYGVLRRWHRRAYETAKQLHKKYRFDLAHQVTFCGYREPGYLWKLDAPFLWGPVGGTQNYPWRFLPAAGLRGAVQEACRSLVNSLQLRLSPRVRAAANKASVILAANTSVQRDFAHAFGITPRVMLETGLDRTQPTEDRTLRCDVVKCIDHLDQGKYSSASSVNCPIQILWSGLLIHRKALHLLLEALARLPDHVPYKLRVIGDGPLRNRWERLARRLRIAQHIAWLGRLPFHESLQQYDWADLFAFTSLRDTSGNVVLEALASGVPVLCLDHQGVHDIVTDRCGVKIPVIHPSQVIADFSRTIARLAGDREERLRLRQGALDRAKAYLWSRQEDEMTAIYHSWTGCTDPLERPLDCTSSGIADDDCILEAENCFFT